ncbi:MAG: hypothetical protein CVV03_08020 [Firmicutes bacterium HGW-Firmicutes-8]|nr:MAG: hypothetical protein CVV03_08020 [Firmicutes bacterium HGW-Firmicutes-8]
MQSDNNTRTMTKRLSPLSYMEIFWWSCINSGAWIIQSTFLTYKVRLIINLGIILLYCLIHLINSGINNNFVIRTTNKKSIVLVFVLVLLLAFNINNEDSSQIGSYLEIILMMLSGLFICQKYTYQDFTKVFINIILVISIFSIVFTVFGEVIRPHISNFPLVEGQFGVSYRNLYVYMFPTFSPIRNSGIFYEPGAFQFFLNISIYMLMSQNKFKKHLFKFVIFAIALYLTNSTTGYLVFICLLIYYVLQQQGGGSKHEIAKTLIVSVCMIAILLFFVTSSTVADNFFTKLSMEALLRPDSTSLRISALLAGIYLSFDNFFFGVGFTNYWQQINSYYGLVGRNIEVATDTITYGISIFGIAPVLLLLVGLFKYTGQEPTRLLNRIVICIAFVILLVSQIYINRSIIYILMFYGYSCYKRQKTKAFINTRY